MDVKEKLIKFKNSETVRELGKYYKTPSLMEVYGVNRKEIRHTSFLKWLFRDFENSKESLKRLIDILVSSKFFSEEEVFKSNKEVLNTVVIKDFEIQNIEIEIPNSSKNNQVDIFISFKIDDIDINIIVENKVESREHDKQTERYYQELKKSNIFQFFVYLTPISTPKLNELNEPECVCKKYIQINYQSILENILEPILKTTRDNKSKSIIEDYIMALSYPYNNKNQSFMAISTQETELLNSFWDENQDLILKAIEATKENKHVPPENRELAEKVSELFRNKKNKIGAYVLRSLKELFSKNLLPKYEIENLQNKEYCKLNFDIQYPFLRKVKISDNKKIERYWKNPITIKDEKYFICSEWYENENNNDRPYFEKWFNKWNK